MADTMIGVDSWTNHAMFDVALRLFKIIPKFTICISKVTKHLLCLTPPVRVCLGLIESATVSRSTSLHVRTVVMKADLADLADTSRYSQIRADYIIYD